MENFQAHTDNLIEKGHATDDKWSTVRPRKNRPELKVTGLFTVFKTNSPQVYVDVDREKCLSRPLQEVSLSDVFLTLQGTLGSRYVNDFNLFGRTWQVIVQADQAIFATTSRTSANGSRSAIRQRGQMVPLGIGLAKVRMISGPLVLTRYNMYPAAAITGNTHRHRRQHRPGEWKRMMEDLARRDVARDSMSFRLDRNHVSGADWPANTGMIVFGLRLSVVIGVLSWCWPRLYESWSLPLAVIPRRAHVRCSVRSPELRWAATRWTSIFSRKSA